ncbi:hypothetical protein RCL_jg25885.t1 [Rhizophagus clarus]|uniref:CCHC-type domain-containing protein n=1 Tax=Rhizophagus clarus TaxID=94130 RepID=A0A8H3LVK8_9GLOM|nr:hypothetical protein RCL_jg25885.t1 [Rhizophagus clarus]
MSHLIYLSDNLINLEYENRQVKCYTCNEEEHYSLDCPNKRRNNRETNYSDYNYDFNKIYNYEVGYDNEYDEEDYYDEEEELNEIDYEVYPVQTRRNERNSNIVANQKRDRRMKKQ